MKKLLIFINCLLIILPFFTIAGSAASSSTSYDIKAPKYETGIALLVNADTDTVIYSKNADTLTAPASLTKLVTALVTLEKCSNLNTEITCQEDAINGILGTGSSIAGLIIDEKVSLEMLLYCLFLPSANDAAAVLAEHFGNGKQETFVADMNEYVKKLGCKNTHFANPHGLDDESVKGYTAETQNRTTASDMYIIAKKALSNATIRKISSKYGKTMPATNKSDIRYLYNTNALLNDYSYYYYEDAIGLKTGTTDKAGACLITSATKNGYTYIAIAMRGKVDYQLDGEERNTAFLMCRYMLRWAFDNMQMKILADTTYNMGETAVKYGRGNDYVALVPSEAVSAVVSKDATIEDMKLVLSKDFPTIVDAPIKEGDKIGTATLMYGKIKIADITLVAQHTVKKNYIWAMFNWAESIVTSKVFIIIVLAVIIVLIVLYNSTKKKREQKKRRKNSVDVVKDYSKLSK